MNSSAPSPAGSRPALWSLAWPLFAELAFGMAAGAAGLWLASRICDPASAAFALVNHLYAAFFILFRVVGMGVSVVVSQNLGAGDGRGAARAARASLGATTWLGWGAAAAVAAGAPVLLDWMNAPPDVRPLALPFLVWMALPLALDAYNATMASVMRAHLHARDTLYNMLAMHATHLLLAVPLMRGLGSWEGLGLVGFALAMTLSRALGLAYHLVLWRWRLRLVPRAPDWWRLHGRLLAPMLHIGVPGAAENIAYRIALMVSVAVVARMGAGPLATHGYTMQLMYFIVLVGLAIGFAAEILIGHLVGAGRLHEAHRLLRKSLRIGLVLAVLTAAAVASAAPWLMRIFTQDPAIISLATKLLWITVLLEPGRVFNLVVINALRAAGDARFPVAAGAASMLLVLAGGSWLFGVHLGWGLVGVWLAYTLDEWVRGLIMAARWYRLGWVPHARRTRRRVRLQAA
ncbi:MAG TPA: MATE family efflux transporter [Burkholderiaceae bacterium]|nr:MATE family efflux transporter [Burkholderiaceae bacterium]